MKNERMLVFIPNKHFLIWLRCPPEPPAELLARIRDGRWPLPLAVRAHFEIPPGLKLFAHTTGGALIIRPDRPLVEKQPGSTVRLTPTQVEILRMVGAGMTGKQIAAAFGRSGRWVRYQLADIRRRCRRAILDRLGLRAKRFGEVPGPRDCSNSPKVS